MYSRPYKNQITTIKNARKWITNNCTHKIEKQFLNKQTKIIINTIKISLEKLPKTNRIFNETARVVVLNIPHLLPLPSFEPPLLSKDSLYLRQKLFVLPSSSLSDESDEESGEPLESEVDVSEKDALSWNSIWMFVFFHIIKYFLKFFSSSLSSSKIDQFITSNAFRTKVS